MNVCLKCKEEGKVTRYVGETARTLWERNAEHQQDTLNQKTSSHMREHCSQDHPEKLHEVLDLFQMKRVKQCARALNRQVREALEINMDQSHLLLNSKQEYNRCILPKMTMVGPPSLAVQRGQEIKPPTMTQAQEDEALSRAKSTHKKRVREFREGRGGAHKKIKVDWLYRRERSRDPNQEEKR